MKKIFAFSTTLLLLPLITHAQSFQSMFGNIVIFIDRILIPFLFGMAFLFFVINVFRYFIVGGGNPDAQESAKGLATYGVAAFVFLIIFWGIVNMLVSSTGIRSTPLQSDYVGGARSGVAVNTEPNQNFEDSDLHFDAIDEGLDPENDSSTGCTNFTVDGICTDPAEDQKNTGDGFLSSRNQIIAGLDKATGDTWEAHSIGTTPDSHYFTMRNTRTGSSVKMTYTAINGTMSDHTDYMIRLEEVREPGASTETPISWVTTRFVYNETNNNMEIFSVSNSSEYSRTYNGTAYMNQQGQMVMELTDQYGRPYIATQDNWMSDTIKSQTETKK